MEVDFLKDFIKLVVECSKPVEVKTLFYRGDGMVELSPGNNVPAIIPGWLKDQTIEINLTGGSGKVKSYYGEYDISVAVDPSTHTVTTDHAADNHVLTQIKDADPSHKITITLKDKLKDGDAVVVARFSGLSKYMILEKVND